MIRNALCLFTAMLFFVLAGCGNSNTPADNADQAKREFSPDTEGAPNNTRTETETTESTNTGEVESAALKQEMVAVTVELMKKQQPGTEPDTVRTQVETAIVQVRKEVPDFLMVSAEDEKKLEAGSLIEGSDKRIADAEAFLNESRLQFSVLVQTLLPQHKAGNLNPVRTELLAHLIVADKKKADAALTN